MPDNRPPELIRFLFEERAEMMARHASERLWRWAEAFETWLEERYSQFSRNVGKQSHLAWREFLQFSQKYPWEVGVEEVEDYIEMLQGRGLSPATIDGSSTTSGARHSRSLTRKFGAMANGRPKTPTTFSIMRLADSTERTWKPLRRRFAAPESSQPSSCNLATRPATSSL